MTAQRADEVKSLLKKIDSKSGGLGISEKERKDIVAAIGLAKGHCLNAPTGISTPLGNVVGPHRRAVAPSVVQELGANITN